MLGWAERPLCPEQGFSTLTQRSFLVDLCYELNCNYHATATGYAHENKKKQTMCNISF